MERAVRMRAKFSDLPQTAHNTTARGSPTSCPLRLSAPTFCSGRFFQPRPRRRVREVILDYEMAEIRASWGSTTPNTSPITPSSSSHMLLLTGFHVIVCDVPW